MERQEARTVHKSVRPLRIWASEMQNPKIPKAEWMGVGWEHLIGTIWVDVFELPQVIPLVYVCLNTVQLHLKPLNLLKMDYFLTSI